MKTHARNLSRTRPLPVRAEGVAPCGDLWCKIGVALGLKVT